MFKTKTEKAMDNLVKKYYEFMLAAKELEDVTGIATINHNTIQSNESQAENREYLVRRLNNAAKDALGK